MVSKELSSDKEWNYIYAVLVNELEVVADRAKSEPTYHNDVKTLGCIIHTLHDQGVTLTKEEGSRARHR